MKNKYILINALLFSSLTVSIQSMEINVSGNHDHSFNDDLKSLVSTQRLASLKELNINNLPSQTELDSLIVPAATFNAEGKEISDLKRYINNCATTFKSKNTNNSIWGYFGAVYSESALQLAKYQKKKTENVDNIYVNIFKLAHNKLTSLPREISQLTKLEVLDVSHNKFEKFPEAVLQIVSLKKLNISHNKLTELSASLGMLTNLEELDVSTNNITSLPASLTFLKKLSRLNLKENPLKFDNGAGLLPSTIPSFDNSRNQKLENLEKLQGVEIEFDTPLIELEDIS